MREKSDVRNMLREAGILFVITLLSGLLLGLVFEVTKEPRKLQQERAIEDWRRIMLRSALSIGLLTQPVFMDMWWRQFPPRVTAATSYSMWAWVRTEP